MNKRPFLITAKLSIVAIFLFSSTHESFASSEKEFVWLEAESFEKTGGWSNDPQFIDQMGSPYLLATGMGRPVDDAVTTITVEKAGNHTLWVRTKDWIPEHHPGRFQIAVADKRVPHVFGASGKTGWHWENGGKVILEKGECEIRLIDRTGYYGRCDAIVLSPDDDWHPPEMIEKIARLREIHGGVSREITDMPEKDVVVVGGGLAGCTAAMAAARNGASVALIQNRPVLGGNASSELLVPPVGIWPHGHGARNDDPRETGIIEEYSTEGNQHCDEGKLYSQRLRRWIEQEPRIELFLNTHACDVVMESEHRIACVETIHTRSGLRSRFPGKLFLDCTGDAVLGLWAGADYREGKEPYSLHQEPYAPPEASPHTMGNGIKYYSRQTDSPVMFETPKWAYQFPDCRSFPPNRHPRRPGWPIGWQWKNELGGLRDTYAQAEEIRDDLFRLVFGIWGHIKNDCSRFSDIASRRQLVWVGHIAAKRENHRLLGDYILTQNDIGDQTRFSDRVAFGGWVCDDHYSAGFFHQGESAGVHYDRPEFAFFRQYFSIPFRCLYSRNIENLMMAGRNISATHVALSNTRVMHTCAILGHAAGTASAMCLQENLTPRELGQHKIADLQQQLLKEGAYLIDLPGEDPEDLARKATITASSTGRDRAGNSMPVEKIVDGYSRLNGEDPSAWRPDDAADRPHHLNFSWPETVSLNLVQISFQSRALAPRAFELQVPEGEHWRTVFSLDDNRHRRLVIGLDRLRTARLRLVEHEPAGICEIRIYDIPEEESKRAGKALATMRIPDEGPFLPWGTIHPLPELPGIFLDDTQARKIGHWVPSTWSEPFFGGGYRHDGNQQKGARKMIFQPNAAPGEYEIRLSYVPFQNRASNTPVVIHHADGTATIEIDQRKTPPIDDQFVSVGTYRLNRLSTITVGNEGTDGYVVVDALHLLPVEKK